MSLGKPRGEDGIVQGYQLRGVEGVEVLEADLRIVLSRLLSMEIPPNSARTSHSTAVLKGNTIDFI